MVRGTEDRSTQMSRTTLKTLTATLLLVTLAGAASAQELNLDLSGLMQQNLAFDSAMNQQAANFATQWFWERQRWRQENNYWGYLPGPFTAQDLVRANNETSAAFERNNRSWSQNFNNSGNGATRFAHAMRGTIPMADSFGNGFEVQNGWNSYWRDNQDQVFGTNDWAPPSYAGNFTPLTPAFGY